MSTLEVLATGFTTISAYHLQALVAVNSKQFVEALNISVQNALLYTSKLNLFRFFVKFVGSLLEFVVYNVAFKRFNKSFENVLDDLETELVETALEKQRDVGKKVNQILSADDKDTDSIVDELVKKIKVGLDKTNLNSFKERIKNPDVKETDDLKRYESVSWERMLQTLKKEQNQINEILGRYDVREANLLAFRVQNCTDDIFKIPEILKAKNQDDNVLFDYQTLFAKIMAKCSDRIWKIMKPDSKASIELKGTDTEINKKFGNKFIGLLQEQVPLELKNFGKGMERKFKTIEMATEISESIVEKNMEIKTEIEKQSDQIIGSLNQTTIDKIREAIMRESEEIKRTISEVSKGHGFGGMPNQIRQKAEKISEGILKISSIKKAVDKYAPSYTLMTNVLEYIIKNNAEEIGGILKKNEHSGIAEKIKNEMDKDLFKTFVKNIVSYIIIENSTQIAKDGEKIENQIKGIVKTKIDEEEQNKKVKKVVAEIRRKNTIVKKAGSIAKSIVEQNDISGVIGKTATTLGHQVSNHKDEVTKITQNVIKDIITECATAIAKRDKDDTIGLEIVSRIQNEIGGKLTVKKKELTTMKTNYATIQVRKIMSIIVLGAMLATRAAMLWVVNKSTKVGYQMYIIMIIESLLFGMFQTSLLTLAAENSETIRLSIELSNGLVMAVQAILIKLFYKRDKSALTAQIWIICVLNVFGIIIWICRVYAGSDGTNNKEGKEKHKDNNTTLWSPYLMFLFVSLLKDFLYPKIVPNALITEKPHTWTVVLPLFFIAGILTAIVIEWVGGGDPKNLGVRDGLWSFLGPPIVVCVMAIMAIHTKGKTANSILDKKGFVILLCFGVQFCYAVMSTVSYLWVAKYVEERKKYFSGYIESHSILCDIFAFFISRLSGGYDRVRKEYGLGLNVLIRDAIEPPKASVFVRECITATWKDIANDFKTKISDCL